MKKQVKMCCHAYASKDDIFKEWKGHANDADLSVGQIYILAPKNAICYDFKITKQGLLSLNPMEAEVVQGISVYGICKKLTQYKYPFPADSYKWESELIQDILCNERYAGYKFITENDVVIAREVSKAIIPKQPFAVAQELQSLK